ncbi:MAG: amidohydrolase family protein [Actinomycetota bacterium]|nr:amidohydrolase family protein [Actinomycetota bacterium]
MTKTLIRRGRVVDGSGSVSGIADVGVEGDRIVAVGPGLSVTAADCVIDARDRIVTPGFIDIHSHYDAQVLWDPTLSSSCHHGVTTVVNGNCGFSLAPLPASRRTLVLEMLRDLEDMPIETLDVSVPREIATFSEYLRTVREREPLVNFASFIGHSTIRLAVMGAEAFGREATGDEVAQMQSLVRGALEAGAVGLATKTLPGSRPSPSQFASTAETEALLQTLGRGGTGIAMFNPGGNFGLERLYEAQPRIGLPFTWIALLAMPDGSHRDRLAYHASEFARGAEVYPQVSPRPLVGACRMAMPSIFRAECVTELNALQLEGRMRLFAEPDWRDRFRREARIVGGAAVPWSDVVIRESPSSAHLVGVTLAEAGRASGRHPTDVLLDLAGADGAQTRVELTYGNSDPEEVSRLLNGPGCVLGLSDAGAHPSQMCDAVLPTALLGSWVRDRRALSLEKAIEKLTSEPARLFGFPDRGLLRQGYFADLVILDSTCVDPGPVRSVRDLPADGERMVADRPIGIDMVMVNGQVVRREKALTTGRRPGRVLSPQRVHSRGSRRRDG